MIFSICILVFLMLFQVIFFHNYYEYTKRSELKQTTQDIFHNFDEEHYENYLDNLSHDSGICIELIKENTLLYSSASFNRGCMTPLSSMNLTYKKDFINSALNTKMYELTNPKFNNKTLLSALRLKNDFYIFISVSLEPLDSATILLKRQFFYITILVIGLSFLLAYVLSKKISKPILEIHNKTKRFSKGDYKINFETNTQIKEICELETTLNEMKEDLSKTEELRMELLSNVSHDLKTPLTMIKAYAEMVRDLTYQNEEKRNQNLNTIIEETERLNELVNDILTLSITSCSIYTPNLERIHLKDLIDSILKRYEILKETENYQFLLEYEEDVFIKADKKQLEQVIYNLINNAINYTGDDNKVFIRIRVNEEIVRLEITDTGKGMDKKELNTIWNRYYHSDKKHKRGVVGTGLGLSIVKNILESHQFPYGVLSKKGCGTTFYFEMKKELENNEFLDC